MRVFRRRWRDWRGREVYDVALVLAYMIYIDRFKKCKIGCA
jgi:hypothetical protein